MKVALIVAADEDGVIGRDGGLPWHLPADLAHFQRVTMGHHLVIGRRTWESFAKPLPGRTIVVVSSAAGLALPPTVVQVGSLAEGLELARSAGDAEVMIGGGTAIFAAALPLADRLYLTRVHARVGGDTRFPPFDEAAWREVSRREHPADDRHAYAMTFRVLERAGAAGAT
jgi:dihydrofolate reductase